MSAYDDLHNIIRVIVRRFVSGQLGPPFAEAVERPFVLRAPPAFAPLARARHPSAHERRLQVQRIRALRSEIQAFEGEFQGRVSSAGRLPTSAAERAPAAHLYEEYRSLKQRIREDAVLHIQAVYRGARARQRSKFKRRGAAAAGLAAAAAAAAAAAPRPSLQAGASLTPQQRELARLRDEKAQLKRQLRQFDVDFAQKHGGRQPSKAEKEHLRPLYTRYHELKAMIGEDPPLAAPAGGGGGGASASASGIGAAAAAAAAAPMASLAAAVARRLSLGSDAGLGSGHSEASEGGKADDDGDADDGAGTGGGSAADAALLVEKKELQAFLREFEKKFEAQHGRKVKYVKDIDAVKEKYARYKALKLLLRRG
jgi:hypothetical protein